MDILHEHSSFSDFARAFVLVSENDTKVISQSRFNLPRAIVTTLYQGIPPKPRQYGPENEISDIYVRTMVDRALLLYVLL